MSKALGFIFFVFIVLVVGNIFVNATAALLHSSSLSYSYAAEQVPFGPNLDKNNNTDATPINFSLFAKDGSGTSYVTQGYGRTPYSAIYPNDWHDGIDIAAAYGMPIYSPNDGVVIAVGNQDDYCYHKAFGKYVAVRDAAHGLILWYAHLGTQTVYLGQMISKGSELGTVGATGLETGTHLHFSIFQSSGFTMTPRDGCGPEPTGQDVDPLDYLGSTYK